MLLIAESELSSIMTSESSAALGHHQSHAMLGDHEDPDMFTARTYTSTSSPSHDLHHSPAAQSPSMTVAPEGQLQQHQMNHFSEMVIEHQQLQQQQHHQPMSPHHQWDINDTVLPVPKVHDPFCLWPTGHCRRTYRGDSDDARRHVSGWAMRNTNNHNALILKKSCLGVLVCSRDCVLDNGRKVHLRPAICDKARRKQLAKPCPNPNCPGRLELLACRGHCGYPVTHFWRHLNGSVYFQAKGYHDHPRPDVKSLSDKGRNVFNKQIKHEGNRVMSVPPKRRFPILTNEAIPDTKRQNQIHDEVMCSCPPFECVCPKSAKKEELLQQQHFRAQHQFGNIPHEYLTEPHAAQHPCSSARTVMPGTDQGYPLGPLPHHPPPPFTQINITNTCLPPTASLDLNIPSVEIVTGCYSSNPQLHLPDQYHYNSLQSYAYQQHKAQFDYPYASYHPNENTFKDMGKAHKDIRQDCGQSEEKRRKLDHVNAEGDKDTAQFSCKFTAAEQRSDSRVSQDYQHPDNPTGADLIYGHQILPHNQIPCDFDKTAIAQNYKAQDESLVKEEKLAKVSNALGDERGTGHGDRLPGRLVTLDLEARNNCHVNTETQYDTPVNDSSFLYDTISTVFGADQRREPDPNNHELVNTAQVAKGEEAQNKCSRESSQSPHHVYNFLGTYTAPNQTQGPSPPIYTELTSPPRQNFSDHNDGLSGPAPPPDQQIYPYQIDASIHSQHQPLQQQQYHSHLYHHHHQNHQQLIESSPQQANPADSFAPSMSQQTMLRNPEGSNENQYNMYSHAPPENPHLCHPTNSMNYSSYSAVAPHSHYNEYSPLPLNGDAVGTGNMPCSYPCNESAYTTPAASQQAYRNRSINITLTYN